MGPSPMGEAAHVQGLASSLTQLFSVLLVVLLVSSALVIYLLSRALRCLLAALERWRVAAAGRALDAAVRSLPTRLADDSSGAECAICLSPFAKGMKTKS